VILLIAFVIDNPLVEIILGVYVIFFSAIFSFINRPKDKV
jgi:hypothetical protein